MIKLGSQLQEAAEQLEREKGIPRSVFMESIKEAMMAAYKRYAHIQELEDEELFEVRLYEKTGELGVFKRMQVVETIDNAEEQINLHDALGVDATVKEGDELYVDITPTDFGRIAAQSAKQVMTQRIREAEKRLVYQEFEERRDMITPGIIQRIEGRNVIVSIGRIEAVMPPREQIPGEYYRVGNKIRVYVADLRDNGRVPQIIVSQAHPQMVREVFELEVPEIEDGLVEIKNIAREAGFRTKVAVNSPDGEVDPQGACIGARGSRIQAIVNELKNEKIDIIRWSEDPGQYITNALAPAKIINVDILSSEPGNQMAQVVVPDDQLSLAIGREGQNVRLAAKLTGWKLDIKSISQIQAGAGAVVPRPQQQEPAAFNEAEGEEAPYDEALAAEDAFDAPLAVEEEAEFDAEALDLDSEEAEEVTLETEETEFVAEEEAEFTEETEEAGEEAEVYDEELELDEEYKPS
jgi:transcription termination/antitermination protein NusA